MFSTVGLFNQVPCPEQPHCSLPNCIFSHHNQTNKQSPKDLRPESPLPTDPDAAAVHGLKASSPSPNGRLEDRHEQDKPRKRLRLSDGSHDGPGGQPSAHNGPRRQPLASQPAEVGTQLPTLSSTLVKEVSPPPQRNLKTKAAERLVAKAEAARRLKPSTEPKLQDANRPAAKALDVSLNPSMIRNPPAPHAVRMQLIKLLHEQVVRLNEELLQSQDPLKATMKLSPEELIHLALEEEETAAKQNAAIYLNIVKLRITKLKKMNLVGWKEERQKQISSQTPDEVSSGPNGVPKTVETGLTTSQEIALLSKMLAKQEQLTNFGYVANAPSNEEVESARKGIEASLGWEQCDRCKTRFQVFPGRREGDGALTSGGSCSYHPVKPRRPLAKDKADKGHHESMHACCNETVGTSIGCTTAPTHVYKVSDPKRLALIMPFKETPYNSLAINSDTAVCFDCEMGYTTLGLELIRITATSWPDGKELLDVLVRPLGEILDLNSRFSGVWPKDYTNASPYSSSVETNDHTPEADSKARLQLVESPKIARDLLFGFLTPKTPLIGHALDNDLNAMRMIHPSIVDSVLLYPHPRGLPIRFGLKMLMKKHLDRDIQMAGAKGHDSKEDARAAGDLVKLKVAEAWRTMQKDGWTVKGQTFSPPSPPASVVKTRVST